MASDANDVDIRGDGPVADMLADMDESCSVEQLTPAKNYYSWALKTAKPVAARFTEASDDSAQLIRFVEHASHVNVLRLYARDVSGKVDCVKPLAKRFLGLVASQASCERSFSTAGLQQYRLRRRQSPQRLEALVVLRANLNLLDEKEEGLQVRGIMDHEFLPQVFDNEAEECLLEDAASTLYTMTGELD